MEFRKLLPKFNEVGVSGVECYTNELGYIMRFSEEEYNSIFYTIEESMNHLIDGIIN